MLLGWGNTGKIIRKKKNNEGGLEMLSVRKKRPGAGSCVFKHFFWKVGSAWSQRLNIPVLSDLTIRIECENINVSYFE